MSDAEKHDGDQSRDASAEVPQTREERVQACMRLMPAQWERGKTAKRLAAEWGVGINVVEQASAEAWRRLKAQDATVVRETLAVECADSLDLARTIDDPAKSVTARMQVVVLVERSQELVDWLLPKILPLLARRDIVKDIIMGDARAEVPKLIADVALIDIFPTYGGNKFYEPCPGIPVVWCWGGSEMR